MARPRQTSACHTRADVSVRYAVVLSQDQVPAWQAAALTAMRRVTSAELVACCVFEPPAPKPTTSAKLRKAVAQGFAAFDRRVFKVQRDPWHPTDVAALLADVPRRTVDQLAEAHVDIIVDLTFTNGAIPAPRHASTWQLVFGEQGTMPAHEIGLEAVAAQDDCIRSRLVATDANGVTTIIYDSYAPIHSLSVRLSQVAVLWKSATFVARALRQVTQLPAPQLPAPMRLVSRTPMRAPTLARGLAAQSARFAWQRAADRWRPEKWTMAFRCDPAPAIDAQPVLSLDQLTWLIPPPDRFWADPFVVRDAQSWIVFFEESIRGRRRAHLCGMRLDERGSLEQPFRVMERDFHLSYPFVFQWQGEWWLVPETSRNRTVELWRATNFPTQWSLERVLLQDLTAVDATLHEHQGTWWMFCNVAQAGASSNDELALFYAASPLGPWHAHAHNPVRSDVRNTRPAGRIFFDGKAWIRPAQNCAGRYGSSIVLNRIEQLDVDGFRESPIGKLLPNQALHQTGVHTVNAAAGLTIFDVRRRVPRS